MTQKVNALSPSDVHVDTAIGNEEEDKDMKKAMQTLYIRRDVLNANEILEYFKRQATYSRSAKDMTTLTPEDLHVTVMYSRTPVEWANVTPRNDTLVIDGGELRTMGLLGDKNALVMFLGDVPALQMRNQQLQDENGAVWDYEGYHPHITISYNTQNIEPYMFYAWQGKVVLGPEKLEPVKESWSEEIVEKGSSMQHVQFVKVNDEQRCVTGWVSVIQEKGVDVIDLQGDVIKADVLQKSMRNYMESVRVGKADHDGGPVATCVEMFTFTPELQKSMGIDLGLVGTLATFKVHCDKTWARVKSGELKAFSIGGMAASVEI